MIKTFITSSRLSVEEIQASLPNAEHGAQLLFLGVVRDHNYGKKVIAVEYDVHAPLAEGTFKAICEEAILKWGPSMNIILAHRVGRLEVGEASVVIAVGTPHRQEAYFASRFIIDQVKHRAPIWKKEFYQDGETEWLEGHSLCRSSQSDL